MDFADNPHVNRSLDDKALDHVDHALGRPVFPLRESYRNHFATEPGGALAMAFDASPWWEQVRIYPTMAFYKVTHAGRLALHEYLGSRVGERHRLFRVEVWGHSLAIPAISRSEALYGAFLGASDAYPDIKFIDFARAARVLSP